MFAAYRLNWSYDFKTANWIKENTAGYESVLLFPCGIAQQPGAIRADRDISVKPDIIADLFFSPFKKNSFDFLVCDPPYKIFVTGKNRFRWLLSLSESIKKKILLSSNIDIKIKGWKRSAMYATVNGKLYIRLWQDYESCDLC